MKAHFGHRIVAELDKKEVRTFFRGLEGKGYCAHNKAVSVLKAACNYVIDFENVGLIFNPFERIKKMPGVIRSRYLTHKEARHLMNALECVTNQDVADIYRMALFTGARLTNVKTMEWKDINFSNSVWLIPSTRTKTHQNYEIPLHPLAVSLLSRRQRACSDSHFVFPSKQKSKYGYITGGDSVWKEAIKRAGLYHDNPNIRPRPHDLRRTFATWQIQSGADVSIVSKALCHTSLKHTMVYAHANIEQIRNSIQGAFSDLES
nr:site-specific integrase [Pseudomonadota bacterium]